MSVKEPSFEEMQEDIIAQLEKLKAEEVSMWNYGNIYYNPFSHKQSLNEEMNFIIHQAPFLDEKIKNLKKLIPSLKIIKDEAVDLVDTIKDISESSEKISGKIRALDEARVCFRIIRRQ